MKHRSSILSHIGALYRIESSLRERKAGPALREAERACDSRPILDRLAVALRILKPKFLPQSDLGKAISYALSIWPSLQVYLNAGRVELDNNLIENAIRPTAVGKNYGKLRIMQSYAVYKRSAWTGNGGIMNKREAFRVSCFEDPLWKRPYFFEIGAADEWQPTDLA